MFNNFSITEINYYEHGDVFVKNEMEYDSSGIQFTLKIEEEEKQRILVEFNNRVYMTGCIFFPDDDPEIQVLICDIEFDNNEKVINNDVKRLFYQFDKEACEKFEENTK